MIGGKDRARIRPGVEVSGGSKVPTRTRTTRGVSMKRKKMQGGTCARDVIRLGVRFEDIKSRSMKALDRRGKVKKV